MQGSLFLPLSTNKPLDTVHKTNLRRLKKVEKMAEGLEPQDLRNDMEVHTLGCLFVSLSQSRGWRNRHLCQQAQTKK